MKWGSTVNKTRLGHTLWPSRSVCTCSPCVSCLHIIGSFAAEPCLRDSAVPPFSVRPAFLLPPHLHPLPSPSYPEGLSVFSARHHLSLSSSIQSKTKVDVGYSTVTSLFSFTSKELEINFFNITNYHHSMPQLLYLTWFHQLYLFFSSLLLVLWPLPSVLYKLAGFTLVTVICFFVFVSFLHVVRFFVAWMW